MHRCAAARMFGSGESALSHEAETGTTFHSERWGREWTANTLDSVAASARPLRPLSRSGVGGSVSCDEYERVEQHNASQDTYT